MKRFLRNLAAAVVVSLLSLLAVFFIGMRRKSPVVVDAVRRFNKAVSNPKQMDTAGTPGAYASIIEHVGRKSGTIYRTPVGTEATDDGFLIMLPYGTRADWVRNVLAAGSAVVTAEGESVAVDQPEILDTASISDQLPDGEQRLLKLFNVEQCMRVRRVGADITDGAE